MLKNMMHLLWFEWRRDNAYIIVVVSLLTALVMVLTMPLTVADNVDALIFRYVGWWAIVVGSAVSSMFFSSFRDDYKSKVWHGMLSFPISALMYVLARWMVFLLYVLFGSLLPIVVVLLAWKISWQFAVIQFLIVLMVLTVDFILVPLFNYMFFAEMLSFLYFLLTVLMAKKEMFPLLAMYWGVFDVKSWGVMLVLMIVSAWILTLKKWRYIS